MYIDGILSVEEYAGSNPQSLFVVVGKEPPHDVYVYHAEHSKAVLPQGRIKYEDTLERLARSIHDNDWLADNQKAIQTI